MLFYNNGWIYGSLCRGRNIEIFLYFSNRDTLHFHFLTEIQVFREIQVKHIYWRIVFEPAEILTAEMRYPNVGSIAPCFRGRTPLLSQNKTAGKITSTSITTPVVWRARERQRPAGTSHRQNTQRAQRKVSPVTRCGQVPYLTLWQVTFFHARPDGPCRLQSIAASDKVYRVRLHVIRSYPNRNLSISAICWRVEELALLLQKEVEIHPTHALRSVLTNREINQLRTVPQSHLHKRRKEVQVAGKRHERETYRSD